MKNLYGKRVWGIGRGSCLFLPLPQTYRYRRNTHSVYKHIYTLTHRVYNTQMKRINITIDKETELRIIEIRKNTLESVSSIIRKALLNKVISPTPIKKPKTYLDESKRFTVEDGYKKLPNGQIISPQGNPVGEIMWDKDSDSL